jgi:hypothetical protein
MGLPIPTPTNTQHKHGWIVRRNIMILCSGLNLLHMKRKMKTFKEEMVLIKTLGVVWYVKWFATILVIIAVACRSVDEIPKIYDVGISFVGTILWLWVALQWKDRALIILNSVMVFMLGVSILRYLAALDFFKFL